MSFPRTWTESNQGTNHTNHIELVVYVRAINWWHDVNDVINTFPFIRGVSGWAPRS